MQGIVGCIFYAYCKFLILAFIILTRTKIRIFVLLSSNGDGNRIKLFKIFTNPYHMWKTYLITINFSITTLKFFFFAKSNKNLAKKFDTNKPKKVTEVHLRFQSNSYSFFRTLFSSSSTKLGTFSHVFVCSNNRFSIDR